MILIKLVRRDKKVSKAGFWGFLIKDNCSVLEGFGVGKGLGKVIGGRRKVRFGVYIK